MSNGFLKIYFYFSFNSLVLSLKSDCMSVEFRICLFGSCGFICIWHCYAGGMQELLRVGIEIFFVLVQGVGLEGSSVMSECAPVGDNLIGMWRFRTICR